MAKKRATKKSTTKPRRQGTPTDECVIPPPLPPDVAGQYALNRVPDHRRLHVSEYVELETHGEKVTHAELMNAERIFGRTYEVWDVHTVKERYWVISSPTNLYAQSHFPSADYTLSFHVGLMARVGARREPDVPDDEQQRSAAAWRRWTQAAEAMDAADEAEDFQAVGMRCRECLLELVRGMADDEMVPSGADRPKAADFNGRTELIAAHVASGASAQELRRHLRSTAKSTLDYVNWLTHATAAARFDAMIAVESTALVLTLMGAAVIRKERGAPDRCPSCNSYLLDSVYTPDRDGTDPYVLTCRRCGWKQTGPQAGPGG